MKDLQKIKTILLLLISIPTMACDVCSCGASNSGTFTGNFNGHYIGFSYNYLHFSFKESIADNSIRANDYINVVNVLGQYQINDHLQVNAIVPYRINKRETSSKTVNNSGIGDVTLYGLYNLMDKESKHRLKIGAGLKLPTGDFNLQIANSINQTSAIQLGTGSVDVLLPLQYSYKHKDLVMSLNAMYFIKNKNNDDFKFGNQTQVNAQLAYQYKVNTKTTLVPKLGVGYDQFLPTERFGIEDKRTSGYMATGTLGLEVYVADYVIGVNYQMPLNQELIRDEVKFENGIGIYTYWRF